jgi:hypothetical protein
MPQNHRNSKNADGAAKTVLPLQYRILDRNRKLQRRTVVETRLEKDTMKGDYQLMVKAGYSKHAPKTHVISLVLLVFSPSSSHSVVGIGAGTFIRQSNRNNPKHMTSYCPKSTHYSPIPRPTASNLRFFGLPERPAAAMRSTSGPGIPLIMRRFSGEIVSPGTLAGMAAVGFVTLPAILD